VRADGGDPKCEVKGQDASASSSLVSPSNLLFYVTGTHLVVLPSLLLFTSRDPAYFLPCKCHAQPVPERYSFSVHPKKRVSYGEVTLGVPLKLNRRKKGRNALIAWASTWAGLIAPLFVIIGQSGSHETV
jgi:hypothetical protein